MAVFKSSLQQAYKYLLVHTSHVAIVCTKKAECVESFIMETVTKFRAQTQTAQTTVMTRTLAWPFGAVLRLLYPWRSWCHVCRPYTCNDTCNDNKVMNLLSTRDLSFYDNTLTPSPPPKQLSRTLCRYDVISIRFFMLEIWHNLISI